ncbi:MAG: YbaN family protein [Pseudomonadota bacterium]
MTIDQSRQSDKSASKKASRLYKLAYLSAGMICVALGFAGAALPLLPTTPFLLLAAFCFARSSPRLHAWLLDHKHFGPLIENWRRHGAISPKAKRSAYIVMAATPIISIALGAPPLIIFIQIFVLGASALFVATRPNGTNGAQQ